MGCALFWPFDLTRYFAPWTPLPVSPIGLGYLSPYGLYVAAVEMVLFVPLLVYALRRQAGSSGARPITLVVATITWLVALWLLVGTDALRERAVRAILRDDTQFTDQFSETRLSSVGVGDTATNVRALLGQPFRELGSTERPCWLYSRSPDQGYFRGRAVCFANGRVTVVVRRWVKLE